MTDEARELVNKGDYTAAAKLLQEDITERSNHVGHTLRAARDLAECLEKSGRSGEIKAVLEARLAYYLQELKTVCESIDGVEQLFVAQYGNRAEVPGVVSKEGLRKMMQTVMTLMMEKKEPVEEVTEKVREMKIEGKKDSFEDTQKIILVEPEKPKAAVVSTKPTKKTRRSRNKHRRNKKILLHTLPAELIQKILAQMEPPDLVQIMRVCRKWHEMVVVHSDLYRMASFVPNAQLKHVKSYIATCQRYGLKDITYVEFPPEVRDSSCEFLELLAQSGLSILSLHLQSFHLDFSRLRNIDLSNGNAFEHTRELQWELDPDEAVDAGALVALLPNLRDLVMSLGVARRRLHPVNDTRPISFGHLDNLQFSLCEDGCTKADMADRLLERSTFHGVDELMFTIAGLAARNYVRMLSQMQPHWIQFEDLKISCQRVAALLNVVHLQPETLLLKGMWGSQDYAMGPAAFAHLKTLEIGRVMSCDWHDFCAILDAAPQLSELRLNGARDYTQLGFDGCVDFLTPVVQFRFADVFRKCPNLEVFGVHYCQQFDDARCRELGEALEQCKPRKLNDLRLGCENLTDTALRSLFSEDFALPQLEIELIHAVCTRGTIEYLRRHCMKVWYFFCREAGDRGGD